MNNSHTEEIEKIARRYSSTVQEVTSPSRKQHLVWARRVFIGKCRERGIPADEIALSLNRCESSIWTAFRGLKTDLQLDPARRLDYAAALNGGPVHIRIDPNRKLYNREYRRKRKLLTRSIH